MTWGTISDTLDGAPLSVGGSAGTAHTEPGDSAAAGRAVPNQTYVAALRQIVAIVEQGAPAPQTIMPLAGEVMVSVAADDLPAWMLALELPAPSWVPHAFGDGLVAVAHWAEGETAHLTFRLSASRTVAPPESAEGCPLTCSIGLSGCTQECHQ